MANKKEYTIVINGIKESYEGVKSLAEVLDSLKDTVIKVTKEEEKSAGSKKSATSSTDALAKSQEKLANWDAAYQEELAKTNAKLSANKKEINELIKVQQAEITVGGDVGTSYREKQQYLSALNTLIRNNTLETEEQNRKQQEWIQKSAELQQELKDIDSEMKIYVRNVGNYQGAADTVIESHKSLKQELKEIKSEMAEMLANGVSKTDEGYLKLAERAGQLKDAMGDASQDIANFASDTRGLSNAINLATSAVNAYQLYNSALQVFGFENENAAESMQKMMAIMTLLNSLQQVQNSLLENGSATARLYSKSVELIKDMLGLKKAAVEADTASTEANSVANETNSATAEANAVANETASAASETNTAVTGANTAAQGTNTAAVGTNTGAVGTNTAALGANTTANQTATTATNSLSVAQKAGAVASKTLSVALRAIPLMFIIGLVISLIQNWESIWNWFKKTFPVLDTISKKFNKFGGVINTVIAVAKGFASAVVNWLINPIKTFANVISKVLSGDFSGAIDAAMTGLKNQFKGTADAFRKSFVAQVNEGQESITRKQAAEEDKRLTHHKNMITKQKNADGTYRKDYIKAEQAMYDNRKKMYKKGSDEYNKVLEEEAAFHQKVEDAKTAATQKGVKAREAASKKAAADAKKSADEYKKMIEELQKANKKAVDDADKMIDAARKKGYKASGDAAKIQMDESFKQYRRELETIVQTDVARTSYSNAYENSLKAYEYYVKRVAELTEQGNEEMAKGLEPLKQHLGNTVNFYKTMVDEFEGLNATLQSTTTESLDHIKNLAMERKSAIVNLFGEEAIAVKAEYIATINSLNAQIDETQEELKKASGDTKTKLESDLTDLNSRLSFTLKAAKAELGDYYDEFMNTPVEVDIKRITEWITYTTKEIGRTLQFEASDVQNALLGVEGTISGILKKANDAGGMEEMIINMRQIGKAAKVSSDDLAVFQEKIMSAFVAINKETDEYKKSLMLNDLYKTIEKDMTGLFSTINSIQLSKFGTLAQNIKEELIQLDKEISENVIKAYQNVITSAEQDLTHFERNIRRFQEATKDVKFEPAMQDDILSDILKGQIIDLDKTRDRYEQLLDAYTKYRDSLEAGSTEMKNREAGWQVRLEASKKILEETGKVYGTNSNEYKKAQNDYEKLIDEKTKEDAAYVIEYEKAQQKVDEINQKSADLMYDYIESIANRAGGVVKAIQDNVFNPIFDGLGDLFSFELEKAQEALDEIEELLDKAVEAREESAARMQEINNELRADDGRNKEALQQRLAEEEVLLVQREETERALEKEKKKREYEVNVAEAKQRKFELGQKLIEGLVNTALGVTAALKYGPILGPIFAAVIGAMGALQTGIIAKQIGQVKMPQKFAKGGRIGEQGFSRSHSQGGHRIEGTNIEVEGQEWVVNKKSSKKYNTLLNAINDDNAVEIKRQVEMLKPSTVNNYVTNNYQNQRQFAGKQIVKYASGGQLNYSEAARTVEESRDTVQLAQLIKQINFQPQVAVTDINRVNKNLTKVRDLARG